MKQCTVFFRHSYFLTIVLLLVTLLKVEFLFAAEEPYLNDIRGQAITTGAKFDVTDEKFLTAGSFYGSIRPAPYSLTPENFVELKLNYDTSLFFSDKKFTAIVNVSILCYNNAYDTSQVFTQYNNINLIIRHDTASGVPYTGVSYFKFSGAYKFRVIINSVTCPELGTNMPPVLIVEGKTIIKRKYNFSPTTVDVTKIEELPGQVKLNWVPGNYSGAEMFDLEYTIVDDSSTTAASLRSYLSTSTPIPAALMEGIFRNNASRIVTSASNYTISSLYQAGFLLFRIRGVQFHNEYQTGLTAAEQNLRTEGNWNYTASKLNQPSYQYNVVHLDWHEPNLNWQYTISFAEEGKRKEVIGYFDGILKNRQNVTLNNSDNRTIVQETIYDAIGRSAINVLPSPVNESTIHFFPNFNRNKNGKGYSYKDFLFGTSCRTIADTMSRVSGAHQYYSSSNNINDYFFKKYIPQAEGYPFTVTEYTADNTGRVFSQGGVGKDFQPGTNHETKYYYSKPTQEELDRLFGSEAGDASHYLKNMVVDPNNQISVSYINSSGQIVATALAGNTPTNVEALNSNNGIGTDVSKTLLLPTDFTKDYASNTLLGNSSFLAAVSGNYKFSYNLQPLRLDILHGSTNQYKICNTCYYDLVITVKDNCSQILKTVNRPVDPNTIFSADCNTNPPLISDTFSVDISNIGEYSVSYFLKVSEKALAYYDSSHLVQNTNLRTFTSFAIEKLNNSDFKGCFSECTTCIKELGTKTDFINNKIKPLFIQADSIPFSTEFDTWAGLLYDSLLLNCNNLQSGCSVQTNPCDEEKEMLLYDVTPGGQYSPYDPVSFSPTETVINVMYNYRSSVTFYNEDGSVGMIEHDGILKYANDATIPWELFIKNFQPSWANALLPYHPEYCFYQWCLYGTNPNSKAFDETIKGIEDDSTAIAKGYFGSIYSLLNSDPFFSSSGLGYPYNLQMADSLALFSRTIAGYSGPDFTILQYIDYELYCEPENVSPGNCTFPAPNASCRSPYMEWQLYRDYYLNLKAYFYEKARLADPSFATCRNCFIGSDNTEFLKCVAPPNTDFNIQIDPTYTGSGKRIIVKYKSGESAALSNYYLTINYSGGVLYQLFHMGRATEQYIVAVSTNGYTLASVSCEDQSGQSQMMGMSSEAVTNSSLSSGGTNCPCPDGNSFYVYTDESPANCSGNQCGIGVYYTGTEIPAGRTVAVDLYWYDYYTEIDGYITVYFTGSQTVAYACLDNYSTYGCEFVSLDIYNIYCNDDQTFYCPGNEPEEPSSLCKDDPLYPYYKDKVRRYGEYQNAQSFYQDITANYSTYQNQAQANFIADCQANCEAQADAWINAISKCTTDANLLNTIRAGLISICQSGCDTTHPYGASTNPSLTQSFESLIRQYIPNSSDSCTAELISDPYPYNRQPQLENRTLIKIDNCLTTRFSQLKSQFLSSGFSGSFHQWLQKQLKNDYLLSEQELISLEASINANCKYLKKPLLLPVAFNCSNTPACLDSATTMQTYSAFLTKFPGVETSSNYEVLLTNYFNHTFGFNLNFDEYKTYIGKCQTGTTNKDLLCNKSVTSQAAVKDDVITCIADVFNLAISQAVNEHRIYIDSVRAAFRESYMGKCMNVEPKLTMNAKLFEYHYTLYYYDQSGNLVKTIPPAGVKLLNDTEVAQVVINRNNTNNYCASGAPELLFNANIITMPREYSYDPVIDGKYSLESWLKLGNFNPGAPNGIFSYNANIGGSTEAGYSMLLRNGKLVFIVGTSPKLEVETVALNNFLSVNTWFHVAVTVNSNVAKPVKIYINGNDISLTYINNNSSIYNVSSAHTHRLYLGGAFENNSLTAISGSGIKQFRWYQRELTISEIKQNAFSNCLIPASQTGLISYIPVNEGVGYIMEDKVPRILGTMSGSTSTVWSNFMAGVYPKHQLPTTYQYNSLNQVIRQTSPDGGTSTFWYDGLGRLVASQNAEQKQPKNSANSSSNRYSYTKYDPIGRISEVGEKYGGGTLVFEDEGGTYDTKSISSLTPWYYSGTDKQVTQTIYDEPATSVVNNPVITNLQTVNTRKRVVASIYKELKANTYYDFGTHYVYDINGNVKTLFQESYQLRNVEGISAAGIRQINYDYDLVSGKVNKVVYQPGKGDQFIHWYKYDADNRITEAYTSRNGLQWQRDAKYYYYLHGPLARTELGKYQVQGVDYAYTLQGWLKGINSQSIDVEKDIAGDANQNNAAFKNFGKDVYGFSLGYHNNDYKPIGESGANAFDVNFTAPSSPVGSSGNTGSQLFNGNISNSTLAINKINNGQITGYSYLYDQLNRLMATRQHSITGTAWDYGSYNAAYEERAAYDANGNIKTYSRKGANNGSMPLAMDNLKYHYYYTNTSNIRAEYDPTQALPADVKALTNQLAHVGDTEASGNYTEDIDNQNNSNYDYDNIGNLIKDNAEGITSINWTVYGKIKQVVKNNGVTINYSYDAAGNRVIKEVIGAPGGYNRQFYIRDAQGNTMAVYKDQTSYVNWVEQHLYGSSRLGIWNYGNAVPSAPGAVQQDTIRIGSVNYELTNHLGNVLAVISDKKIGTDGVYTLICDLPSPQNPNPPCWPQQVEPPNGIVDHYTAEVISANDYYPGGMLMPGRKYNGGYRYGFNGKENDNEVKGEGNQQDYGMRIYDPRLGKFLSVDPLTEDYPWLTPYQFASNSPIAFVDQDGEELAYRLPDGKTYIPQGDNLRLPIPNNATLIPGQVQKNNVNLQGISTTLDLIPGLGTFKGAVEGVVGYDMAGNKLSTTDRVLGVIPYVKVVKKVKTINNLVKATDKVDEVKDATKAANKIDDAKTTEKAVVKNKNANDAEGDFMLYDVHADGPKQGKILKVGKANEAKKRADGTVDRLAVSQRKARKAGYPNATATPRKSLGRTTTKKATDAEAAEVVKERAQGNDLPLNKERAKKYKGDNQ